MDCEVLLKSTLTVSILLIGCFFFGFPLKRAKSSSVSPANDHSAILVGAGDIADCKDLSGAEATAKLLDQLPGTVMAVGDLAYPDGSKEISPVMTRLGAAQKPAPAPRWAITSSIPLAGRPTSIISERLPVTRRRANYSYELERGTSLC